MATDKYYIGPWQWNANDPGWEAPPNTIGLLNLRSIPDRAPGSGGFGFFATNETLGSSYLLLGTSLGDAMTAPVLQNVKDMLNLQASLQGVSILEDLFDIATVLADPTGLDRMKPLMPTDKFELDLHLGGHSLVRRELLTPSHPGWANALELMQADYKLIHNLYHGRSNKHLKHMGAIHAKWRHAGVTDDIIQAKVPPGQRKKHLPPGTSFTESWPTDGNPTSGQDQTWTEVFSTSSVISGELKGDANLARMRAAATVGSVDHLAQCVVTSARGNKAGICTRYAAAADSNYSLRDQAGSVLRLVEFTAGSATTLANVSDSTATPLTLKLRSNGTTQEGFVNGGSVGSVTDSTHSTGTQGGTISNINGRQDSWLLDDEIVAGGGRLISRRRINYQHTPHDF